MRGKFAETWGGLMKKILVVDDEPKIRRIYRKLLAKEGYEVIEAESGDIVDLLLYERGIDLVLLDLNMPVVDGPTLYDLLKLYDPGLKVVVTSVYPVDDQKKMVLKANDYYDKSQSTSILLDRVQHLMNV